VLYFRHKNLPKSFLPHFYFLAGREKTTLFKKSKKEREGVE